MTNHEQILDVLRRANGNWVCTTVFDTMFIRDHRKRVSELIQEGHKIESEPCRGECGKKHNSNIYKRRLPQYFQPSKQIHPPVEQRAVQPETTRRIENTGSQTTRTNTGNYAYSRTEEEFCCPIFKASKFAHSQGCGTQKVSN